MLGPGSQKFIHRERRTKMVQKQGAHPREREPDRTNENGRPKLTALRGGGGRDRLLVQRLSIEQQTVHIEHNSGRSARKYHPAAIIPSGRWPRRAGRSCRRRPVRGWP